MYIVTIEIDKCKGCEDCIDTCPNQMIALVEEGGKKYAIFKGDPADCIGCLACESGCEEGAVKVTEF